MVQFIQPLIFLFVVQSLLYIDIYKKKLGKETDYSGYIHRISLIYIVRNYYNGGGTTVSGGKTKNEYFAQWKYKCFWSEEKKLVLGTSTVWGRSVQWNSLVMKW